jgi:hypothetical protein
MGQGTLMCLPTMMENSALQPQHSVSDFRGDQCKESSAATHATIESACQHFDKMQELPVVELHAKRQHDHFVYGLMISFCACNAAVMTTCTQA